MSKLLGILPLTLTLPRPDFVGAPRKGGGDFVFAPSSSSKRSERICG
jgi:hypothetical protein